MVSKRVLRERSKSYKRRKVDARETRQRFLIVCEGAKTEPKYFLSFRVPKDVVDVDVVGVGDNTFRVVQAAIDRKDGEKYDQVWCVFDRDSFPAQHFNEALRLAKANNISVAYSNESFELWYLLHFNFYSTAIHRADYITRLSTLLGRSYQKNSDTVYEELIDRQYQALDNARRLYALYSPSNPERDNPSTTVHLLVEELNRFLPGRLPF
jgi:hypothetical protein